MKTQIIQLEPHDDHISIRDKMNWSKTPRILLVLPRRHKFDLNALDLKLLQRHAINLGAELGLVTKSSKTIRAADELGIPNFDSNLAAQREAWIPQKRIRHKKFGTHKNLREVREKIYPPEAKWRAHSLTRLGFFSLAALALLTLAFAFIPQAQIEIEPERRIQSIIIPVRASVSTEGVFLSGSVPAYELRADLTNQRSLVASGRVAIPAQVARGSILFRNLTEEQLIIPAGTVIRSIEDEEIRFATLDETEIAGGLDAEVEVRVKSLVFGERGNLAPNLLQAIEGELNLWLAATNPEPTSGGGDNFVSAPTNRDRDDLRDLVMAFFYKQAEAQITKELAVGDVIFPDTLKDMEVLEEIYDPLKGETGDRLTLIMRVGYEGFYAKESDLEELAQSALSASIPPGFAPAPDTLHFAPESEFETNPLGITSWQMRVEQDLRPNISPSKIASLAQGRSPEIAAENLEENLDLTSKPKITISPTWWKWLPLAPFRIDVIVK